MKRVVIPVFSRLAKLVIFVGVCCYFGGGLGAAMDDIAIYTRVAPERYRIRIEATAKPGKSDIFVYLPLPESTPGQTIENMEHSVGEAYTVSGSLGEKRLKVVVGPDAPKKGETVYVEFDATLWSVKTDFEKIAAIHPYDTASELYQQYTREELPYFDLNNEKVAEAATNLAASAKDDLDFARRAYSHVLDTIDFKGKAYLFPVPLADVLKAGQGSNFHAGNYFVSLLRRRGIPARNVFALNVSGDERRWQEFYLERYGWIPVSVDLTQEFAEPSSFFGMAIAPPFWHDRQPQSVVLGYTVAGELPGIDESKTIKKYMTGPKILVSGGKVDKPQLLIQRLE